VVPIAGEFLPPVVTVLEADISPLAGKLEEAKALIESLGNIKIPVGFDLNAASAAQVKTAAQTLANSLGRINLPVNTDFNAASLLASEAAAKGLTDAINGLTSGVDGANGSFRVWGTGIRLNTLGMHILLASAIDFAAIAGPALVAAGAWAADWAQGAGMVYQHMTALYDATESLGQAAGKTFGNELGLKDALQAAQNAANPQVYEAMGGALNLVREQFGDLAKVGLQVGGIFDTFMAHLDVDFSKAGGAGTTMDNLLKGMVPDLVGLGQVLGNVGHGVALLANDMPGFAHVLLGAVDGVTSLAVAFLNLGHGVQYLPTIAFGFHEFQTWGSAAVNIMGRLGMQSSKLTGNFFSLSRAEGILSNLVLALPMLFANASAALGGLIGRIGIFAGSDGLVGAGAAIESFGVDAKTAMAAITPLQGALIAVGAAGLGFFIDQMLTAKSAAQQYAASMQNAVSQSSNLDVLNVLATTMGDLDAKLLQGARAWGDYGGNARNAAVFADNAADAQRALSSQLSSENSQFVGVIAHAQQLGQAFGTTMVGGMALAQAAGVNLDKTLTGPQWAIAYQQVENYVAGMRAMGQSTGQVGADMSALAISEGIQSSKVQTLNSAWDSYIQTLTGGTSDLGSMYESLTSLTQGTNQLTTILGTSGSATLSVKQFAATLKSFSGTGAEAWQNFDQVMSGSMESLADWLRQAQTEGAVTGTQFSKNILDMASALVPFAGASKAAQAQLLGFTQEAGLNIQTWPQLLADIKSGHDNLDNLSSSISSATIKMANMNQVAQQLGNVVQTDFINEVGQAIVSSRGMTGQIQQLIQQVQKFGATSPQAENALTSIRGMLEAAGVKGSELKTILQGLQQYIDNMHGTTLPINIAYNGSSVIPGASFTTDAHARGYASGTPSARPGWAWVGEEGRELIHLRGGEQIIPHHRLNGYAEGAGMGGEDIVVHSHVHLNDREIATAVNRYNWKQNFANGSRTTGGRPTGIAVPRPSALPRTTNR
jgi:hypothetical protein